MKPHHEVLPSVIEALKYFGPLTPYEIVEKLALRHEIVTPVEVINALNVEIEKKPGGRSLVREAIYIHAINKIKPFSEKTFIAQPV